MAGAKKKGEKGKAKKGGKKSGGGRAQAILDGVPMTAMTRDQLEGHVTRLRNELEREREERNYVQLEQERLQRLWEVATQHLDHERSVARLKDAEMAEAERCHLQQLKVAEHKMKNLMGEQEETLSHLQVSSQDTLVNLQDASLRQEGRLAEQLQQAREELASTEARWLSVVANLKVEHSRRLQEEREHLLLEAQALSRRQEEKLADVIEQLELKRKTELEAQETRKNKFLEEVMAKHQQTVQELKKYYTDITEENLREIAQLKRSAAEQSSREGAVQRRIAGLEQDKDRLEQQNRALQQQAAGASRALTRSHGLESSLKKTTARLRLLTSEKESLQWEMEVLTQRAEKMEQERDQLYSQLASVVGEVRQRSELKNLVLEGKLAQLSEQLDRREAVLSEVLAATNMDPASVAQVTRQLETIIEDKNRSITELRTEVARIRRLYTEMVDRTDDQAANKTG